MASLGGKHQNSTISTTETTETTNGYRPTLWDDVKWRVGYPLVCNIAAAERLRRQALNRRPSAAALLWLGLQMGATATIRNVAPPPCAARMRST